MFIWEVFIIFILILLNGAFAMSELAVVSSRKARLKRMAAQGSSGAAVALRLIADPSRFLSTVQIGITLIGIVAGAYGGATLGAALGAWLDTFALIAPHGAALGFAVVIMAITYCSLVFGELVPKRVALHNPERIAVLAAPPMMWIARAAAPLVWLLKISIDTVLRLLKRDTARDTAVTEDEVKSLITEGTLAGIFVPAEREMIEGVLRLADRAVRVIMTPRNELVWLDVDESPERIREKIRASNFSRFPVCRGEVDELLGIVQAKDLLDVALSGEALSLSNSLIESMVVSENTPILRLLEQFKKTGEHIALVVDEFGMFEGVVTLTDIMESIVGELPEQGEIPIPDVIRREDGSWLVDGAMPIDEFEDRVGLQGLRELGRFETVGGFVLHILGRFPVVAEHFIYDGTRFEIVDMDGRRIDKVLVQPSAADDEGETLDL